MTDYTRSCDPDCVPECHQPDEDTQMCKYCCYGDRYDCIFSSMAINDRSKSTSNFVTL